MLPSMEKSKQGAERGLWVNAKLPSSHRLRYPSQVLSGGKSRALDPADMPMWESTVSIWSLVQGQDVITGERGENRSTRALV